jgi:hypothetical protein
LPYCLERDPADRRRHPIEPARDRNARSGAVDATRRTHPPNALRHRDEQGAYSGGGRPAVLGDHASTSGRSTPRRCESWSTRATQGY